MTSEERREARYQRRKAKRQEQKEKRNAMTYEEVFSFDNTYNSFNKCKQGVMWKPSVQGYAARHLATAYRTYSQLMDGTYKSKGFVEFDLMERGKPRHIRSVHISERVVQRCLCDHYLTPALSSTFIYDNGASLKGKGIHFAMDRLCEHLRWHYRRYGTDGYALVFDFAKYFDRADHAAIFAEIDRCTLPGKLREQSKYFIRQFGERGLGLGSQVSQVAALALPNRLDHYIKEQLGIHCYARYMDDGYLIHPSKEYLKYCLKELRRICAELGIALNEKKTQIIKLTRGITFLKGKYHLTAAGKVIRRISRRSVVIMRRKLKKLKKMLDAGRITAEDIRTSFASWLGYAKHFRCFRARESMKNLYEELLICTR